MREQKPGFVGSRRAKAGTVFGQQAEVLGKAPVETQTVAESAVAALAAQQGKLGADGIGVVGVVFGLTAAAVVADASIDAVLAAAAGLEGVVPVGKAVFRRAFHQHGQFLAVGSLIMGIVQTDKIAVVAVAAGIGSSAGTVLHCPSQLRPVQLFFRFGAPLLGFLADITEHMVHVAVNAPAGIIGRQIPCPCIHVDGLAVVTQFERVPRAFFKPVVVFDTVALAIADILPMADISQCFTLPICRPHIRQLNSFAVGTRILVDHTQVIIGCDVVAEFKQGAGIDPVLRIGLAAGNANTAIVGTPRIGAPSLFVVFNSNIFAVAVGFGFFAGTAGINHQRIKTFPRSGSGNAGKFLAAAADNAAFYAQIIGFFFGNIIGCGFGFVVD